MDDLVEKGKFGGFDMAELDPDISMFVSDQDKLIGCALFARSSDDLVQNLWVYMDKSVQRAGTLASMLSSCVDAAEQKLPVKAEVTFVMAEDAGENLLKKLMPKAKPADEIISYFYPVHPHAEVNRGRMSGEIGLQELTEDTMKCAGCKHSESDIISCAIYEQKPDIVLDGGECSRFEQV